jgi:hypothetical protein
VVPADAIARRYGQRDSGGHDVTLASCVSSK